MQTMITPCQQGSCTVSTWRWFSLISQTLVTYRYVITDLSSAGMFY